MEETKINRSMKDRLFRLIFKDRNDLLELYNAVPNRSYKNPEELIITTLEDAVYMGMKNDLSFLIGDILNLYEHQGSFNPNMPIRGFHYFSDLYRQYMDANEMNVYGSKLLMLPTPQYVVFYNGSREEPDRTELRLSDSFIHKDPDMEPCLECKALMLNINYGHNQELMEKCKRLKDYVMFIHQVRENQEGGMTLSDAAENAMKVCIRDGILADILSKNRAEVLNLILYEYDEQKQRQLDRRDAFEEGIAEGMAKGITEGMAKGITAGEARGQAQTIVSIVRKMSGKGKTLSTIAEDLELEEAYVKKILRLLKGEPEMSDLEIANELLLLKPERDW